MHDTYTVPHQETWRPLPKGFKLAPSKIEGFGLFTTEFIPKDTNLGITHVYTHDVIIRMMYPDGWIRSGIGAWYNHSDTEANCESIHVGVRRCPNSGDTKTLKTLRDILPGEEILVQYTIYLPRGDF